MVMYRTTVPICTFDEEYKNLIDKQPTAATKPAYVLAKCASWTDSAVIGKKIVLVPIAFVSEHSETLVELDIEYKELADKNGCIEYIRIPALGTNPDFINSMSEIVINKEKNKLSENLYPPKNQCPNQFKKCPCL